MRVLKVIVLYFCFTSQDLNDLESTNMTWACPRCRENQESQPNLLEGSHTEGEEEEPGPAYELEALHEEEGDLEEASKQECEDEEAEDHFPPPGLVQDVGEKVEEEEKLEESDLMSLTAKLEALHQEECGGNDSFLFAKPMLPQASKKVPMETVVSLDDGEKVEEEDRKLEKDDLLSLTAKLEAIHEEECGGNDSFLFAKPMLPQASKKVPMETELSCQAGKKWRRSMIAAKVSQSEQSGQSLHRPPRASFIIVPTTPVRSGAGGAMGARRLSTFQPPAAQSGPEEELSRDQGEEPRDVSLPGDRISLLDAGVGAEPVKTLLNPIVEIVDIPESPKTPSLTIEEQRTVHHQEVTTHRPSNSRQSISQLLVNFSLNEGAAEAGESHDIAKLLSLCTSNDIVQFEHVYDGKVLAKSSKLGEGAFGEVFAMGTAEREQPVLKVVPVGGKVEVNGFEQTTLEEISSEVLISSYLSGLRSGQDNVCAGFVELRQSFVFRGNYPQKLLELWDQFSSKKGTENDRPDVFSEDQLYIGLEYGNGGKDLEKFVFKNPDQALCAWNQVAHTLAVAEQSYQFEHRDLHWGNVLIKDTKEKNVFFTINGETFQVESGGVKTHIIDFSLSRLQDQEGIVFKDLSQDPDLFRGQGIDKGGDYQFDVYRMQRKNNEDDWEKFSPRTNVFWLQYLIKKMIQGVNYPKKSMKTALFNKRLKKLKDIEIDLSDYDSASDFVMKKKRFEEADIV